MDRSLSSWQGTVIGPELANGVLTVLGGVIGNVVGLYAGGCLDSWSQWRSGDSPGRPGSPGRFGLRQRPGRLFRRQRRRAPGSFGAALGGSLLGEVAALALAFVIRQRRRVSFLTGFLILPPIGAALVFNSSLATRSVRAGNGLFNLAGGKLGLGVPDVQIRPVFVPGSGARPEMQFNVNVLSVEL